MLPIYLNINIYLQFSMLYFTCGCLKIQNWVACCNYLHTWIVYFWWVYYRAHGIFRAIWWKNVYPNIQWLYGVICNFNRVIAWKFVVFVSLFQNSIANSVACWTFNSSFLYYLKLITLYFFYFKLLHVLCKNKYFISTAATFFPHWTYVQNLISS